MSHNSDGCVCVIEFLLLDVRVNTVKLAVMLMDTHRIV